MHNQDTLAQWRERAQPKTVCQLAEAGLFVTTTQAWPDPMQPESWLIPAGCIDTEPPAAKAGQAAQWQPDSQTWHYIADYRGQTAYRTDNGQPETVQTAGELPAGLTFSPRPSPCHVWDGKAWRADKQADAALKAGQQAEMWERIKARRHQATRSGVFVPSIGKWFHNDDPARQQYTFLRTLPKLPSPLPWKTMDNSFVEMTQALLDELSLKMIADEQTDFANAERHRAAMLKADHPLDYDYSDGWTQPAPEFQAA